MTKAASPREEWDFASDENRGFHEAVDVFPEMAEDEYAAFKSDIAENGLQVPITTIPDGRIIDGRHRWRACMETKTQPRYQVHQGNPWTYVVSANLHRRQLSDSQRAMVGEKLAKRTQGHGQKHGRFRRSDGNASHAAFLGQPGRAEAAELVNVKVSAIERARRVRTRGIPELAKLVEANQVPLGTAERVASTLDEQGQRDFVKKVSEGEKAHDAAPPSLFVQDVKPPIGKGRPKYSPVDVFTKTNAEALSSGLVGIEIAFREVTSVDKAVTPDTASKLNAQIRATKTVLNRLQRLLVDVAKER